MLLCLGIGIENLSIGSLRQWHKTCVLSGVAHLAIAAGDVCIYSKYDIVVERGAGECYVVAKTRLHLHVCIPCHGILAAIT